MTTAAELFEATKIVHDRRAPHARWSFGDRKAMRAREYLLRSHGWKLKPCIACNGSGRYDHNGSPDCGGCDGTGRESYRGPKAWPAEVPMPL